MIKAKSNFTEMLNELNENELEIVRRIEKIAAESVVSFEEKPRKIKEGTLSSAFRNLENNMKLLV
jgi:hypothetical protein